MSCKRPRTGAHDTGNPPKKRAKRSHLNQDDQQQNRNMLIDKWNKKMCVLQYAQSVLSELERKYQKAMNRRKAAIELLSESPNSVSIDEDIVHINNLPTETIKLILFMSIGDPNQGDQFVLTLIRVCKLWRETIHLCQGDQQQSYHTMFWYGSVRNLGIPRNNITDFEPENMLKTFKQFVRSGMDWKHLVLVPAEYLKLIINQPQILEMSEYEIAKYGDLVNSNSIDQCNTNIPLLIMILMKCPNIHSLNLEGVLCEDIFFAVALYCNRLTALTLSFAEMDTQWLRWLVEDAFATRFQIGGVVKNTLRTLNIQQPRLDVDESDQLAYWFSKFTNLTEIDAERWNISGDGLCHLFRGCKQLESIRLDRSICDEGRWHEAFSHLTKHNTAMRVIQMNGCGGFDDQCLRQFIKKQVDGDFQCPNLAQLVIPFHSCSKEMIREFKRKRPDVELDHGEADSKDEDKDDSPKPFFYGRVFDSNEYRELLDKGIIDENGYYV